MSDKFKDMFVFEMYQVGIGFVNTSGKASEKSKDI
jgi:hypothetical protein